jgi:chemotaxis protein CheD
MTNGPRATNSSDRTRRGPAQRPPCLPGFEHVNRYWDNQHGRFAAKILPGEYYVTCMDEMVVTVLGSCVSACVRDSRLGIGGMNHFMLPINNGTGGGSWDAEMLGNSTRYGSFAMERLVNDILRNGGRRQNLEVKVFGGGRILAHITDIGQKNIAFVRKYVQAEGLRLLASDIGDIYPRKVYYLPAIGKAFVKKLLGRKNDTILEREKAYLDQIAAKPVQGDIELF